MGHIYALIDPLTNKTRYIGKTNNDNPKIRLYSHICESKTKRYYSKNWIKGLIDLGLRPIQKILVKCDNDKLNNLEQYFIKHYKQFCKLTNLTDGGSGPNGRTYTMSEEHKNNIRNKLLGVKKSEEHCRNMGIAKRGIKPKYKLGHHPMFGTKMSQETKDKLRASGTWERARQRMLGPDNPGKKQIKKVFYIPVSDEKKEQNRKMCSLRMRGMNNPRNKQPMPIKQYDLNGNYIRDWDSCGYAGKVLGLDAHGIQKCCKGRYNFSQGYIWKYKQ